MIETGRASGLGLSLVRCSRKTECVSSCRGCCRCGCARCIVASRRRHGTMAQRATKRNNFSVRPFWGFTRVVSVAAVICSVLTNAAHAEKKVCLQRSDVSKWEAIGVNRLVAHQGSRYLAFVTLDRRCPAVRPGRPITLRFFSPSICPNDLVKVNGTDCHLREIEPVRQH
jgi:hypothetical protein